MVQFEFFLIQTSIALIAKERKK